MSSETPPEESPRRRRRGAERAFAAPAASPPGLPLAPREELGARREAEGDASMDF